MGSLRTIAALAGLMLAPLPLRAEALPDLRDLAICTGRLSAVMEDARHDGGPAADLARLRRDAMADVLNAVTPAGAEVQAMDWRLQAKAAQAALLAQARFGAVTARPAATLRADALARACLDLVS
jgi:hypothetical protein